MKKIIAILLSLIFVVSLCSCSSDDDKIRFGAAGIGGIKDGVHFAPLFPMARRSLPFGGAALRLSVWLPGSP